MAKTMLKHSVGPWQVQVDEESPYGRIWSPAGEEDVAEVIGNGRAMSTIMGNAFLLAAAPRLLEALRVLAAHAQETYPHFESPRGQRDIAEALAAIEQAETGK